MSESKTIRMNPTWETALGLQTISSDRRGPVLSLADDVDDDVATVPTVAATAMAAMVPTTVAVVAAAAPTAPAAARDVATKRRFTTMVDIGTMFDCVSFRSKKKQNDNDLCGMWILTCQCRSRASSVSCSTRRHANIIGMM